MFALLRPLGAVGLWLLVACGESHPPREDGSIVEDASGPSRDGGLAEGGLPASCFEGTAVPCDCPGDASGYRYCEGDDVWGECECPVLPVDAGVPPMDAAVLPDGRVPDAALPDSGTTCTGDPEWCDGRDNDCDGVVDNGEPCPDSSVHHTVPYDGAVWMTGYESRACHPYSIQRVWPTLATDGATLGCRASRPQFSARAGTLHFENADGIVRYDSSGDHVTVATPPCFDAARFFGFDAMLLFTGNYYISGVLGSGKLLVQEYERDGSTTRPLEGFVLLDTDGTELSRIDLSDWVGRHQALWSSVTIQGDAGFVAFSRTYRGRTRHEIVIFRVDGDTARWRKVRRVPVESVNHFSALPLPDGRLLYRLTNSSGDWYRLMEFPPDRPPRVILHSGDDPPLDFDDWRSLVAGPDRDLP